MMLILVKYPAEADFDVAHSKMTDIRQLWTSEWEGFRIVSPPALQVRNCTVSDAL